MEIYFKFKGHEVLDPISISTLQEEALSKRFKYFDKQQAQFLLNLYAQARQNALIIVGGYTHNFKPVLKEEMEALGFIGIKFKF